MEPNKNAQHVCALCSCVRTHCRIHTLGPYNGTSESRGTGNKVITDASHECYRNKSHAHARQAPRSCRIVGFAGCCALARSRCRCRCCCFGLLAPSRSSCRLAAQLLLKLGVVPVRELLYANGMRNVLCCCESSYICLFAYMYCTNVQPKHSSLRCISVALMRTFRTCRDAAARRGRRARNTQGSLIPNTRAHTMWDRLSVQHICVTDHCGYRRGAVTLLWSNRMFDGDAEESDANVERRTGTWYYILFCWVFVVVVNVNVIGTTSQWICIAWFNMFRTNVLNRFRQFNSDVDCLCTNRIVFDLWMWPSKNFDEWSDIYIYSRINPSSDICITHTAIEQWLHSLSVIIVESYS